MDISGISLPMRSSSRKASVADAAATEDVFAETIVGMDFLPPFAVQEHEC